MSPKSERRGFVLSRPSVELHTVELNLFLAGYRELRRPKVSKEAIEHPRI